MINSLKTIAFFGCSLTSRYRRTLVEAFNLAAQDFGVNMVYFHSIGHVVGDRNNNYAKNEPTLLEMIDINQFDGIIFDGEGYHASDDLANSIIALLRRAKCPVVSISTHVDGFINIEFEDASGIRLMIEHFLDVHHFTKIGFMSGPSFHDDAKLRLAEFRAVMRERGLPEDGMGVFEGDFWFEKGGEAADYFLSLPERPEAIVCANDYMAMSLCSALRSRGLKVPDDIAVSGFDGTLDGQEFYPKLTTATRERSDIAKKSLQLIVDIVNGKEPDPDLRIYPRAIIEQSCGCMDMNFRSLPEMSKMFAENHSMSYNVRLSESALLRLSLADSIDAIANVLETSNSNFGDFKSFFLVSYTDNAGRVSYDSDFGGRSNKFNAVIKIDKDNTHTIPEKGLDSTCLIPQCSDKSPQFYYVCSMHSSSRLFGYTIVSMRGVEVFNEFYNLWIMNLSMMLGNLLKNSRINKLIGSLKELSTKDDLTGMLNRRGFDLLTKEMMRSFENEHTVCTMVIDMDGLKRINDAYGHHEGDIAIKAAADIITRCCECGEISARTGGDEFFIFAPDYSAEKLSKFISHLENYLRSYNLEHDKAYVLSLSYGTLLAKTNADSKLEDLFKVSDTRMYKQKHSKPYRRT